jgi:DNA-binding beta-propeller fold protein YncE
MRQTHTTLLDRRTFLRTTLAAATASLLPLARGAAAATVNVGDLFVCDLTNACVVHVAAATSAQTVVSSGGHLLHPAGIALDTAGDLLVAEAGRAEIIRVDPSTGAQHVVSASGHLVLPWGIAVTNDGTIIVSDPGAVGGTGAILEIDAATGAQTILTSGGALIDPVGIALDRHGFLYVADHGLRGILRVHPKNGKQAVIVSDIPEDGPYAIAVAANGDLYVTTVHHDGGSGTGRVIRSRKKDNQTIISVGGTLFGPYGIDIALNGQLFVTEADGFALDGGVLRIDPTTGAQTTITSSGNFREPIGIVIA